MEFSSKLDVNLIQSGWEGLVIHLALRSHLAPPRLPVDQRKHYCYPAKPSQAQAKPKQRLKLLTVNRNVRTRWGFCKHPPTPSDRRTSHPELLLQKQPVAAVVDERDYAAALWGGGGNQWIGSAVPKLKLLDTSGFSGWLVHLSFFLSGWLWGWGHAMAVPTIRGKREAWKGCKHPTTFKTAYPIVGCMYVVGGRTFGLDVLVGSGKRKKNGGWEGDIYIYFLAFRSSSGEIFDFWMII